MRLDLSQLDFIDSSGVQTVVLGLKHARRSGHELEVDRRVSSSVHAADRDDGDRRAALARRPDGRDGGAIAKRRVRTRRRIASFDRRRDRRTTNTPLPMRRAEELWMSDFERSGDRAGVTYDEPARRRSPGTFFADLGDRLARGFNGFDRPQPRRAGLGGVRGARPADRRRSTRFRPSGAARAGGSRPSLHGYDRDAVDDYIDGLEHEIGQMAAKLSAQRSAPRRAARRSRPRSHASARRRARSCESPTSRRPRSRAARASRPTGACRTPRPTRWR